MHAESAYLFRHAVMRDAAYQLHMPGARARLHALVLAILEDLFGGNPGTLDAYAAEMADHARDAQEDALEGPSQEAARALSAKELEYCRRAAGVARRTFQIEECVRFCARVAAHPLASHEVAALALSDAAEVRHESGGSAAGEELARRALEQAQLAQSVVATCRAKSALGRCLSGLAQQGHARQFMEQAIAHARQSEDSGLLASNLVLLARMLHENREHDFYALLAEADELMAKSGDLAGRAEIMMLLAAAEHRRTRDTDRCLAQGQAALELMKRAGMPEREGSILHALGVICADAGRTDAADAYYRQALAIYTQTGSRPKQAIITHNLAQLNLFYRHRYREALRGYEIALHENREMGLPGPESSEAATIAAMWRRLGEPEKALPYSLRAFELMDRAKSDAGLANASGYLGETLLELGRYGEAEPRLRHAIEWHQGHNPESNDLAEFHVSLAKLLRRTGRLAAAEQHLGRAALVYERIRHFDDARLVQFEQGLLQLDAGQPDSMAARAIAALWQPTPPLEAMGPRSRLMRRLFPAMRACLLGLGEFTAQRLPELLDMAERAATVGELRSAVTVGRVLDNMTAAAAESELANAENRKARMFQGFMPSELPPLQRLALLARLAAMRPAAYQQLERDDPLLLEQMREGTGGLPVPPWAQPDAAG